MSATVAIAGIFRIGIVILVVVFTVPGNGCADNEFPGIPDRFKRGAGDADRRACNQGR